MIGIFNNEVKLVESDAIVGFFEKIEKRQLQKNKACNTYVTYGGNLERNKPPVSDRAIPSKHACEMMFRKKELKMDTQANLISFKPFLYNCILFYNCSEEIYNRLDIGLRSGGLPEPYPEMRLSRSLCILESFYVLFTGFADYVEYYLQTQKYLSQNNVSTRMKM
ncbi:hypothetical protein RCL_jg23056.t1 [Rhizophagus clarus]|uniref:Uncharacterized protein n=1 Tax=Rhizophagus clarus TaxID=94130 RepID=A0A8H3L778_9GLOM|nr:hypothetical protein RCL_jg23056.t1 [Rhizophagus clarus]